MSEAAVKPHVQDIVVDEIFPYEREVLWKMLTTADMMGRWLMQPTGFAPVLGTHFTFTTRPAGKWDGLIRCEVLQVVPNERLAFAWRGGDAGNVGYGSKLDTLVTFTLAPAATGTRLRVVHSGFVVPTNNTAFENMSEGWKKVVGKLGPLAGLQ